MKRLFYLGIVTIFLGITACVDRTFDEPSFVFEDPDLEVTTSIAALKAIHVDDQLEYLNGGFVIAGVVVANDQSGNYYETIVIADETGGIELKIDKRSLFNTFPVGRRVFVKTDGLVLGDYNQLIQLGYPTSEGDLSGIPAEYIDDFVIGGSLNNPIQVDTLTIGQLDENYMNMLVTIKDAQFVDDELGLNYADATFKVTKNRTIEDCNSNSTIILRTSGYASFADRNLPLGNGTITAVLSRYNDEFQMYLRDTDDIDFNGNRCGEGDPGEISFNRDFETGNIFSGGWSSQLLVGDADWFIDEFDGNKFAKITNYDYDAGTNFASDAWYISPEVDLSTFDKPVLTFMSACNYTGQDMQVYVTDSYDGSSAPVPAQWTELAPSLSSGSWEWVSSGELDLSSFQNGTVHVAFRYLGSNSDGKTWEVDDIELKEGEGGSSGTTTFEDGFENGLQAWTTYNVEGSQVWEHSTQYGNPDDCARVSGFDGQPYANEDWLISPAIDLSSANSASLSFETAMNYTGNDLEVYLSTDYEGSGDPNDFDWNEINPSLSSGQWEWTPSGNIDLENYIGETLYFAFKFTSTSDESATWEVDNVKVSVD